MHKLKQMKLKLRLKAVSIIWSGIYCSQHIHRALILNTATTILLSDNSSSCPTRQVKLYQSIYQWEQPISAPWQVRQHEDWMWPQPAAAGWHGEHSTEQTSWTTNSPACWTQLPDCRHNGQQFDNTATSSDYCASLCICTYILWCHWGAEGYIILIEDLVSSCRCRSSIIFTVHSKFSDYYFYFAQGSKDPKC